MNTQIQIFDFNQNNLTVITDENGEPWFIAKEVCDVIGINNVSKAISRLEEDEKLVSLLVISGQNRKVLLINEDGLYSLLLTSNVPLAKPFQKWAKGVLKTIHKTGGYNQDRQIETLINEVQQLKSIILSLPAYKPANEAPALSQKEINAIKTDTFSKNAESAIIAYIENKGQCTRREMINSLRATQPFKSVGKGKTQLLHEYINKLKFAKKIKISDESFFLLA
jgi:prophage antirepressor-like protein